MQRWSGLMLVLTCLLSVGCGGQTPEPTPQNGNHPGKPDDRSKWSERAADKRNAKPPPVLVRVVVLMKPIAFAHRNILKIEIEGNPLEKDRLNGYRIKNLRPVEGPLPPAGMYYLRKNITHFAVGKKVEQEVSTEPEEGPYFDKKLPAGIILTQVVLLGKCRADVEGEIDSERYVSHKNLPFFIYEAAYEKR